MIKMENEIEYIKTKLNNDINFCDFLLNKGDVNLILSMLKFEFLTNYNENILKWACNYGYYEIINEILSKNENIEMYNDCIKYSFMSYQFDTLKKIIKINFSNFSKKTEIDYIDFLFYNQSYDKTLYIFQMILKNIVIDKKILDSIKNYIINNKLENYLIIYENIFE
jgi:ankyrin repeat protein